MKNITFHHVTAEEVNDKQGPAIMLTQSEDGYGESDTVLVHPWQLRAICEQFGILPVSTAESAKAIEILRRRLARLNDRIQALRDYMAEHSDHKHADLSYELAQLNTLAELADEWCAEWRLGEDPTSSGLASRQRTQPEQGELPV